jgi:UDP-N-acetylglucosamine 1-carboxyvinyltransferase
VVIDRIELGTYMLAPAIAGGEVELLGGRIDLIGLRGKADAKQAFR